MKQFGVFCLAIVMLSLFSCEGGNGERLAQNVDTPVVLQQKTAGVCPKCRSEKHVVPIVYGLPTRETMHNADSGKVWLGGCIVEEGSPNYYCKKDSLEF